MLKSLFKGKREPRDPVDTLPTEFGFGPYHVVYEKRGLPTDGGAMSVAFCTEALPVEQVAGPNFNAGSMQTVRNPSEMMVALQGVGITVIGAPGVPAGQFGLGALTNITSAPGDLPVNGNPPLGEFQIPQR